MVKETQSRMIYKENKGERERERAIRQKQTKKNYKKVGKKNKSGEDIYERQKPE